MHFELKSDLSISNINMHDAVARLNNDEQLYASVVLAFVTRNRLLAHEIMDALERSDLKSAIRAAHTLKGICGSLGADLLMIFAQEVEEELRTSSHISQKNLDELFHAERNLTKALKAWLENNEGSNDPLSSIVQFRYEIERSLAKVLIIDDTPEQTLLLVSALQRDYRVELCGSGEAAINMLERDSQFDLILLDIVLPGIDGFETLRAFKHHPSIQKIPVILFTGLVEPEDETRGLNLGAVDYITKPFNMAVAKARIRTHIDLKKKTDRLEALSYQDGLTGIENRLSFNLTVNQIWNLHRMDEAISLCMIDVDYFKQFNDHYGHQKGDDCLTRVANALKEICIDTRNRAFRYGGEEFVVILPGAELDFALLVGEKIRKCIEDLHIKHEYSKASEELTVSIGIACAPTYFQGSHDIVLFMADHELYNAKARGRNCVSGILCT